ncbi:hypothetical protein ACFY2W_36755 [Streptomyces sp. NPDC001262]|uniref:hypothetical protein n=1 Tax=unclassified Streptomyces TaxID=2593676 RepID=UPI0036C288CE
MTDHGDTDRSQPVQDIQGDTASPAPVPTQDDSGDFDRSPSGRRPGLWQRLKAAWNGEI